MFRRRAKTESGPAPYRWADDDELAVEEEILDALDEQIDAAPARFALKLASYPAGKVIRASKAEQGSRFVRALLRRIAHHGEQAARFERSREDEYTIVDAERRLLRRRRNALEVLAVLLRRALPLSPDELLPVLIMAREHEILLGPVLIALEHAAAREPLSEDIQTRLRDFGEELQRRGRSYYRSELKRIDGMARRPSTIDIQPGEAWSDVALIDLIAMDEAAQSAWAELLHHAAHPTGGKPAKKWMDEALERLEAVGSDALRAHVLRWFPLVDLPRTTPHPNDRRGGALDHLISERHADILKGLVWICSTMSDPEMARALRALAISAYRKVPGHGPRLVALGNACVWALGAMDGDVGLGALAVLRVRVKFGTAQKGIDKALTTLAERLGLPRDEIEEIGVPAYGLTEVGCREDEMGDFTAVLTVVGDSTELRFRKADGKLVKSAPKAVREEHAEALKELKTAAKEIRKMLPAQRERLDQIYLQQRSWTFPVWRERYLDHPLVGTLARRLIWSFTSDGTARSGIWADGAVRDRDGAPIEPLGDGTTVALWHPIDAEVDDVLAWRERLEVCAITQPFKQAHREIYVLTDAERATEMYSNRFAAHLVRQHQFNALCHARGWKSNLRLRVDNDYPPPRRELPAWNLRVEFWVDPAGEETTGANVYAHLATDQVRYYPIDAEMMRAHGFGGGYEWGRWRPGEEPEPVPLASIPPLVLSETMRDVDLFVGVASVGNDPEWLDGGRERAADQRDYWANYSFGELSETAKTRRAVLERLIPRLAIADRCSFDDRYLVVRGDVRTYRIHLGSSNIQMEPNGQYLCVVEGARSSRSSSSPIYLPFEGDRRLAVILSKAMLLAEDSKITDRTILSQIRQS